MAEYYKHEIAKWNVATDDLTLEQEAAYHRVVAMIRLYERPFRHNLRVLSGMWRCNERRAKRLLDELVEAGVLTIEGGFIIDEKAVEDASTLRQSRVDKASAGHLGGIESGKSRRKLLENNNTGEAPASTREEKARVDKKEGGGGSADARPRPSIFERVLVALGFDPASPPKPWQGAATHVLGWQLVRGLSDDELVEAASIFRQTQPAPLAGPTALDLHIAAYAKAKRGTAQPEAAPPADTLREALLGAMGLDPVSGLTGHGGTRLGTQADMAEAARWLALPGMTPEIVCTEIARIVADKADGPPKSFKYFTAAMQRLSGVLTAPALEPTQSSSNPKGSNHDRQRIGIAANEVARRLSAGSIKLDDSSRDPWRS